MENNFVSIKDTLEQRPDLAKYLFIRGFLITAVEVENMSDFPFYGNWVCQRHGEFFFYKHYLTGMHFYEKSNRVFFIMGHAYNPFTMEHEEEKVLERIAEGYDTGEFIDRINEITGVYVLGVVHEKQIEFLVDPAGMQSACYGEINGNLYISSHPQLIADLCALQMDDFVKEIISYKWYTRVMGPYLPCDMTPFKDVKRIVPNILYSCRQKTVTHQRFYPLKSHEMCNDAQSYNDVIVKAAEILKNNMQLIAKKWDKPYISLTGGIDSNTTFAAANGNYDQYETFSYLSAPKEVPDAEAAARIANAFGVKHHVYHIPDQNADVADYEIKVKIQQHNSGYIAPRKDNESRKRFFLEENCACGVEVKSWVSETIRAYWYKHYERKKMPPLSPKLYRNLYKIFITNRKLAHKIDQAFARYIKDFEYDKIPDEYPAADMHYNEVTWGSWGGTNISEMKFCFDITFAYNNRNFLDLLFKVSLEKRISDQHHLDMKKYLNEELYNMNIRVVNLKETKFRARALNAIFTINSILPF